MSRQSLHTSKYTSGTRTLTNIPSGELTRKRERESEKEEKETHRDIERERNRFTTATSGLVINRATPGGRSLIMQWAAAALTSAAIALLLDTAAARHHHRSGNGHKPTGDISLWIDQQQIKMFSGESAYAHRCTLPLCRGSSSFTLHCYFLLTIFSSFFSLFILLILHVEEMSHI